MQKGPYEEVCVKKNKEILEWVDAVLAALIFLPSILLLTLILLQ